MTQEEKIRRQLQIDIAAAFKESMTYEEHLEMLNTPYKDLPDYLKVGMTKNPQVLNFVRFKNRNIGYQKETFGSRLFRFRHDYGFSREEVCDICNKFSVKRDLPAKIDHKPQKTRITMADVCNYEDRNITPKPDKLFLISAALGLSVDYFAGYGAENRRSKNVIVESRKRKRA